MYSTDYQRADVASLISGLQKLPSDWVLTPVERKNAYRLDWSKEASLSREALAHKIQFGALEKFRHQETGEIKQRFVRATGYGIRTGEASGGILALDVDGHAAVALLQKFSNGDLRDTVIFTSGKSGRRQLLYRVPEEYWSVFKTIKLDTGEKDLDGKKQQLEFRWNGCQSVLPPSAHPQTVRYHWVRSPQDVQVAQCPMWLIELMLNHSKPAPSTAQQPVQPVQRPPLEIFLGKDDRALVNHGTGEGTRNTAAQKLSLNLVATSRRLGELGIDHLDLPRVLYDSFCDRCTPPLSHHERSGWWRNAENVAKQPSLDDEKLMGCYKAWLNKQQVSQVQQHRGDVEMPIVKGEAIYSDDERLRLALLDLSQEKDRIAYVRKRAQICRYYSISKAEVEELIEETERKSSTSRLQRSSLDDLLDMDIQELTWLIPELLPVGEMVILAGSPKSGKTLLAIDAAFAIATGEDDFLGIRPNQGKVLLISNDENARSTKSKLLKRGFRSGDAKNLEIIFNWTIDRMYELEQVLDDFRPSVVIIDSLKSITASNASLSENSAEFANNLYALKNLLNQYNAASILIHHTNKNKEAMGVGKLRGSSAIAGAVWGTWQLEHIPKSDPNGSKGLIIDPSDPFRTLAVFARDVEGQLLALEFDGENNSYTRTDKEVITEQAKLADRILGVLRLNPQGLTGSGIIECLGMTKEEGGRSVYTTLNRMEAKLLISTKKSDTDRRVTLYILKSCQRADVTDCKLVNNTTPSLSLPPSVQNADYYAENLNHNGLQNSQQKNRDSQQLTQNSQQLFDTDSTDDYPKPSPNMDNSELVNKKHTGGREGVGRSLDKTGQPSKNLLVSSFDSGHFGAVIDNNRSLQHVLPAPKCQGCPVLSKKSEAGVSQSVEHCTELESLPKVAQPQIEVGDAVTVAEPDHVRANDQGLEGLPEVAQPQIKVGDAVTVAEPYHVRAKQEGIVQGINSLTGDLIVCWRKDGDNQRHFAHRSYPATELRRL